MSKSHLFATRNDLPAAVRENIISLLDQQLADTFDLYSQTKQAHWNVKGLQFFHLHELFDKLAEEVEDHVDSLAERATSLGGAALGTARMATAASRLPEYPTETTTCRQHLEALTARYAAVAATTRAAIDTASQLGEADTPPTCSLRFPEVWTRPSGSLRAIFRSDSIAPGSRENMNERLVLLNGATGYVGGRLLKKLEALGVATRCLARRPENLRGRIGPSVEVVAGDVMEDSHSLAAAFAGVHTAYYLIHSMGSAGCFEEQDRLGAQNFGQAARAAGVQRIVYLGGLGDEQQSLSPHLRSRHEVGDILRASGVPVIEFRASIVLGSGSLSFELIRSLVERLPVMITPRWVRVPAQPIAINDVLSYLIAALDLPHSGSRTYEIGGADQVGYADLMKEYARQRGLKRWLIPVPVLTPRLSSLWLGLVTPVFARIGRKLIESIRHSTVVRDPAALADFPIRPVGVRQAIADALRNEDQELAQTRWSDALSSSGTVRSWFGVRFGPRLVDSRAVTVTVSSAEAFAPVRRIGGKRGWYCADWLWRLRGALDLLVGGVGLRRGRRDPESLCVGDTVDCWRSRGPGTESSAAPRRGNEAARTGLA